MDAFDIARTVRRQWVLSATLLVLSAGILTVVGLSAPTQYRTEASLLVVRVAGPDSPNPYGITDPAQIQTSTMLVDILGSPAFTRNLAAPGVMNDLTITNESGPVQQRTGFLDIQAEASSPGEVQQIVQRVITAAQDELRTRQDRAQVPDSERLAVEVVVPPDVVENSAGARLRAIGIGATLLLVAATLVVAVVDRLRGGAPTPAPTPVSPPPRAPQGPRVEAVSPTPKPTSRAPIPRVWPTEPAPEQSPHRAPAFYPVARPVTELPAAPTHTPMPVVISEFAYDPTDGDEQESAAEEDTVRVPVNGHALDDERLSPGTADGT